MGRLQQYRLVVVDDDTDSRELLLFILESEGAEVVGAASAQEALNLIIKQQPDVLLCDLMMPCLDGYSLMRLIRSQEQQSLQRLPVIAVSARAEAEAQRQALAVGFQNYVTKPINFEAVIDAVLQLQPSAA